jgi:hypothetical protein
MQVSLNGANLPTPASVRHTATTIMALSVAVPQLAAIAGLALPIPIIGILGFVGAFTKFISDYFHADASAP